VRVDHAMNMHAAAGAFSAAIHAGMMDYCLRAYHAMDMHAAAAHPLRNPP